MRGCPWLQWDRHGPLVTQHGLRLVAVSWFGGIRPLVLRWQSLEALKIQQAGTCCHCRVSGVLIKVTLHVLQRAGKLRRTMLQLCRVSKLLKHFCFSASRPSLKAPAHDTPHCIADLSTQDHKQYILCRQGLRCLQIRILTDLSRWFMHETPPAEIRRAKDGALAAAQSFSNPPVCQCGWRGR
jgi:hypothetical protein